METAVTPAFCTIRLNLYSVSTQTSTREATHDQVS